MTSILTIVPVASVKVQLDTTYLLPAFLLSDEPVDEQDTSSLRAEASNNGTCFVRILRSLERGTYLARVAAHPEQVKTGGYTLAVTDEHLTLAQPYEG